MAPGAGRASELVNKAAHRAVLSAPGKVFVVPILLAFTRPYLMNNFQRLLKIRIYDSRFTLMSINIANCYHNFFFKKNLLHNFLIHYITLIVDLHNLLAGVSK